MTKSLYFYKFFHNKIWYKWKLNIDKIDNLPFFIILKLKYPKLNLKCTANQNTVRKKDTVAVATNKVTNNKDMAAEDTNNKEDTAEEVSNNKVTNNKDTSNNSTNNKDISNNSINNNQ